MKLEEIELLKIKNYDSEIEKYILGIELLTTKLKQARSEISVLNLKRQQFYSELKNKYKIESDFNYNKETGEIIEDKPVIP